MSDNPSHEHVIRVRYAECDQMGCVHHGNYAAFLEEARTEALRDQGIAYRELEVEGVFFVVASMSTRFRRPVHYDDLVTVRTHVERFTRTRIDHAYELLVDGQTKATATTTLACVDKNGKPRVMPDRIWSIQQTSRQRRRDRTNDVDS